MTGGRTRKHELSRDILIYNGNQDKWTKTGAGELSHARGLHAMSLVPAVFEDECIVNECIW